MSAEAAVADATLMKKNAEMGSKIQELETSVVELEKERDFYFNKLRNIEFMLQILQDKGWEGHDLERVVDKTFKVLYATAEQDVAISEDGEVRKPHICHYSVRVIQRITHTAFVLFAPANR